MQRCQVTVVTRCISMHLPPGLREYFLFSFTGFLYLFVTAALATITPV